MKTSLPIFILLIFVCSQLNAQDWANLKRYQKQNAELELSEDPEPRIVFMGNSITEGWTSYSPKFFKANPNYINRGIGGQTTPQMLLRFRQDVIALNPKTVIVLAGINDIAGNTGPSTIDMIADNIKSMIELAESNDIQVILCSVLPANHFPWRKEIKPAQKVVDLNVQLKDLALRHNLIYVDYYAAMVDDNKGLREDLGYDGVHPNAKGYTIMENLIEGAIKGPKSSLPDPLKAGWKGKKVCELLEENAVQRVLKCIFPPKVGHEKHFHPKHFGYTIRGGTFRIKDSSGTRRVNIPDGTRWNNDVRSVHEVKNVGKTTAVFLIVEPK